MDFSCEFHRGEPGLNQGKRIEKRCSGSVQNTCLFLLCEYFFCNHSVLRGRKTSVPSDERNYRTAWRHEFKREKVIDEAYTLGGKIAGLCEACWLNMHRLSIS